MPRETADAARVSDMLTYSRLVVTYVSGAGEQQYLANQQLRHSVERCVELIGEAASKVTDALRSACPDIPWRRVVGQRNVLAHGYNVIDDRAIWLLVSAEIPKLIPQLEKLLREISDEP
jgi:uncharacterized protein with HEPN domain